MGRCRSRDTGGIELNKDGTIVRIRVGVRSGVVSGTTLRSPEVARGTLAPTTISDASSLVRAVGVIDTRRTALVRFKFRTQMLDGALFGGPVVGRVITDTLVTSTIAGS